MSHFTVLVIGENVGSQLEPFWELDLNKKEMLKDDRAEFQEQFKVEDLDKKFEEFKKEYPKENKYSTAKDWVDNWSGDYLNKEKTAYGYYTNPNGHWDWFEIGGRWKGMIRLKDEDRDKQILNELEDKGRKVDSALKGNIANLSELKTYAMIENSEWIAKGEMGWFGCSNDTEDEKEWEKKIAEHLNKLPDNTMLTIVDCHI